VCFLVLILLNPVRLELVCSDFLSAESSAWRFPFTDRFSIPSSSVFSSLAPAWSVSFAAGVWSRLRASLILAPVSRLFSISFCRWCRFRFLGSEGAHRLASRACRPQSCERAAPSAWFSHRIFSSFRCSVPLGLAFVALKILQRILRPGLDFWCRALRSPSPPRSWVCPWSALSACTGSRPGFDFPDDSRIRVCAGAGCRSRFLAAQRPISVTCLIRRFPFYRLRRFPFYRLRVVYC
jgi:hypothetical protein